MNVTIRETGETKQLSIYGKNGIEWTRDLIGDFVDKAGSSAQFERDEDGNLTCDAGTYAWWDEYIAGAEATEREVEALAADLGVETSAVWGRIWEIAEPGDYETHRPGALVAMQSLREEYA